MHRCQSAALTGALEWPWSLSTNSEGSSLCEGPAAGMIDLLDEACGSSVAIHKPTSHVFKHAVNASSNLSTFSSQWHAPPGIMAQICPSLSKSCPKPRGLLTPLVPTTRLYRSRYASDELYQCDIWQCNSDASGAEFVSTHRQALFDMSYCRWNDLDAQLLHRLSVLKATMSSTLQSTTYNARNL